MQQDRSISLLSWIFAIICKDQLFLCLGFSFLAHEGHWRDMMRLEKFREYGSSASDCPTSSDFKSFNLYLYSTRGSTVTKVQINSILCEVSLKNMLLALSASNNFIEFACCPPLVHMNGVRLMRRFFHASACKWQLPREETWHIACWKRSQTLRL